MTANLAVLMPMGTQGTQGTHSLSSDEKERREGRTFQRSRSRSCVPAFPRSQQHQLGCFRGNAGSGGAFPQCVPGTAFTYIIAPNYTPAEQCGVEKAAGPASRVRRLRRDWNSDYAAGRDTENSAENA